MVLRWPRAGRTVGCGAGVAARGQVAIQLGAGELKGDSDGSDQTLAELGYLSANIRNSIAVSD